MGSLPVNRMLLNISKGVHVQTDSSDTIDRDIKYCTEGDGEKAIDDKVAKSQQWKSEPAEKIIMWVTH
jgi:hypothetical protein